LEAVDAIDRGERGPIVDEEEELQVVGEALLHLLHLINACVRIIGGAEGIHGGGQVRVIEPREVQREPGGVRFGSNEGVALVGGG
jgi:hypothetical protein